MTATDLDRPSPPEEPPVETVAPRNGVQLRTAVLVGLLVLASCYTLYFARDFFVPIVLAVLLNLLLSPAVTFLERLHLPAPAGAAIILLGFLGTVGFAAYTIAGPAQEWFAQAPGNIAKARAKLGGVIRPVEEAQKTAEQVEKATSGESETPAARTVTVQESPSLMSRLFGTTQALVVGLFEMLILLYFLLASGSLFTLKLVRVLPRLRDKKKAVEIAREVEGSVSRYLFTVTAINIAEGVILAVALYLLGMPHPLLWGALCAVLIFIPYIGAVIMTGVLFLVAVTTFDTVGQALAVPGAFVVIDLIQSNLVAPHVFGKRMTLNPVAVFAGILLWGELWGVVGVFIAVPLIGVLKIVCDHVEPLAPVGEFLGT